MAQLIWKSVHRFEKIVLTAAGTAASIRQGNCNVSGGGEGKSCGRYSVISTGVPSGVMITAS